MPRNNRRSREELIKQEGRIQLAINALKNHEISSVRRAAAVFHVPRGTLRDRLQDQQNQQELYNQNIRLSKTQEDYLVQQIISRDERGYAPRHSHIQEMAKIILQLDSTTPPDPLGGNWVTNFLKHHPKLKSRFIRHYNQQQAQCEDPKVIKNWFNTYKTICNDKGILPDDIYNFNETSFAMGLITTARVITRRDIPGKPHLIQPGNREQVTTIECINTRGWAIPSTIIFKEKVYIKGWYSEQRIPGDWHIKISKNSWTTDEIGLRWLQNYFIPATTPRTVARYRILVLDSHGSHLTPEFDKICQDNDIIPLCMPSHSSHLLQPLDVGCFGPLKRVYGGLIKSRSRLGKHYINKFDFLETYPQAYTKIFNDQNIKSGFAAAGINPFNPERVIIKLSIVLSTPTPSPTGPRSSQASSILATPYTVRHLRRKTSLIQNSIHKASEALVNDAIYNLQQLQKGFEEALYDKKFLAYKNCLLRLKSAAENLKK